ncbi:hypothetical protein HCU74_08415 [Spongiibacter sp. KMU-166]|uniref:Chromosome partition protein Smc n=1 Tax=Spongiibacter thalassae TaxID=2721624 RepID=A0ABX1GGU7_9GAMM|nr:hypothetical protein [Spongiibacter thalassae]NKI17439.1 hypothetical protein [Spongiibacter thalassae]
MALKDQTVNLILRAKNFLSGDTAKAADSVDGLAKSADRLKGELRALEDNQGLVKQFEKTEKAVERTSAAYDRARLRADKLADKIDKVGVPTQRQAQEFDAAQKAVNAAERAYQRAEKSLGELAEEANQAGINLEDLNGEQRRLAERAKTARRELDDLGNDTEKTDSRFLSFRKNLSNSVVTLGKLAAAATAAGAALAVGALTRFTSSQADLARQTLASAEAFDISAETLQEWQYAFDRVGISGEKTADIMKDVAEKIGDAFLTGGGEAAEVISGLNLNIEQLVRLKPDEQILAISDRLKGMPKPAQIQILEALANDASLLLPLLENNAEKLRELSEEARQRNAIFSEEELRTLADVDSQLSKISASLSGFVKKIALSAAPAFKRLATAIDQALNDRPELIRKVTEAVASFSDTAVNGILGLVQALKVLAGAVNENLAAIGLMGKALVALKLASFSQSAAKLAGTLGGALVTGTTAAASATRTLGIALRALPFLALVEGVTYTAAAYLKLKRAQNELAKSQQLQEEVQEEANRRMAEFQKQTGLSVTSLKDMIRLMEEGVVVQDEYSGKWRLAADEISDAERALRSKLKASKEAKTELAKFETVVQSLIFAFRESKGAGETLEQSIAALGSKALNSGVSGIQALSISLERLALEGEGTRQELSDGLATFLKDLSGKQFTAFGAAITKELERINSASGETSNRLSFMATLLDATLTAAAQRAGIDIGEVLEGISQDSREGILAFQQLVKQISLSGLAAEQADKLIKAGLKQTLEGLDTSEEIQATITSLQALAEAGDLSASQVADLLALVNKRGEEIARSLEGAGDAGVDAGNQIAQGMETAQDSVRELGEEVSRAEQAIGDTAVRAKAIGERVAGFYNTVTANLASLSQKAHDAFQNITGGRSAARGIDETRAKLKAVEAQIRSMQQAVHVDRSGIVDWMKDTSVAAATVERDFYRQKLALEELLERFESGNHRVAGLGLTVDEVSRRFDLLDEQDLSQLQGSVARVRDEVAGLQDSLEDTISSLRQELASLEGDTVELERLRYQEARLELQEQLNRARSLGDRNAIAAAQEALSLQKQAYDLRVQQARERDLEDRRRAAEQAAEEERRRQEREAEQREQTAAAFSQERRQATSQPAQGDSIRLQLPNGRTAELSGPTADINRLLEFLSEAGLRANQ